MQFQEEMDLLLETGRDAGALLLRYFGQAIEVNEKGPLDLVTEADLASEALIRGRIESRFPNDSITAEEGGAAGTSDRRWYIDPLDGTVNFAHGVPTFAVCIAFANENGPQLAIVYNPFVRECFTAAAGRGAFLNGLPIQCSGASDPSQALLFINPHGLRRSHAESLLEIYRRVGQRVQGILNPGSMSLALSSIACGRLDAAAALDVDHFSTPASALIMAEAGARVTDLHGTPYAPGVTSLLAANPPLHSVLLDLLRDVVSTTGERK